MTAVAGAVRVPDGFLAVVAGPTLGPTPGDGRAAADGRRAGRGRGGSPGCRDGHLAGELGGSISGWIESLQADLIFMDIVDEGDRFRLVSRDVDDEVPGHAAEPWHR